MAMSAKTSYGRVAMSQWLSEGIRKGNSRLQPPADLEATASELAARRSKRRRAAIRSFVAGGEDGGACDAVGCELCMVCSETGGLMLLCDGVGVDGKNCNNQCHLQCCEPPLKATPEGDWYCYCCERLR